MEMLIEYLAKGFMTMLSISMPCVLTAAAIGLVVGIISIFAYNYLVTKVDKVQNAMEADIITFLEYVADSKDGISEPATVKSETEKTDNWAKSKFIICGLLSLFSYIYF